MTSWTTIEFRTNHMSTIKTRVAICRAHSSAKACYIDLIPAIHLSIWICTILHTLINITPLNMRVGQDPLIFLWEINQNLQNVRTVKDNEEKILDLPPDLDLQPNCNVFYPDQCPLLSPIYVVNHPILFAQLTDREANKQMQTKKQTSCLGYLTTSWKDSKMYRTLLSRFSPTQIPGSTSRDPHSPLAPDKGPHQLKLLLLTYKSLHATAPAPPYLADLLHCSQKATVLKLRFNLHPQHQIMNVWRLLRLSLLN